MTLTQKFAFELGLHKVEGKTRDYTVANYPIAQECLIYTKDRYGPKAIFAHDLTTSTDYAKKVVALSRDSKLYESVSYARGVNCEVNMIVVTYQLPNGSERKAILPYNAILLTSKKEWLYAAYSKGYNNVLGHEPGKSMFYRSYDGSLDYSKINLQRATITHVTPFVADRGVVVGMKKSVFTSMDGLIVGLAGPNGYEPDVSNLPKILIEGVK